MLLYCMIDSEKKPFVFLYENERFGKQIANFKTSILI